MRFPTFLAASLLSFAAAAQTISTVAGGGIGDGGPALSAFFWQPDGIAIDGGGNVFVVADNRVRKIAAGTGTVTTIAGNGTRGNGYAGDGVATDASFSQPRGIAVDSAGNVYVADELNRRVRKISGGVMSTLAGAGTGVDGFIVDGMSALLAPLNSPSGVAVDAAGNVYIGDWGAGRVLRVQASDGTIRTVLGPSVLTSPVDLAMDGNGRLLIADTAVRKVFRYDPAANTVVTVAGNGANSNDAGDGGPATAATLAFPKRVSVDAAGNIYITTSLRVRRVDAVTGIITTAAGNGAFGSPGDGGPATAAAIGAMGTAVDSSGALFIVDNAHSTIRKVSGGVIDTFAGIGGTFIGDGNPATEAIFQGATGVARDAAGNLYIAAVHRIRKVAAGTGIVSTIAGTGFAGFSGDGGPATSAQLNSPEYVAVHPLTGELYISDTRNNCVRKVDAGGNIVTVAGGGPGFADGVVATSSTVAVPRGLAFDAAGNLYIAEYNQARIRKVAAGTNLITTVPGTANLSSGLPYDVKLDSAGNLYFAIANGILRVDAATGAVTTVFGNGALGGPVEGAPAVQSALAQPAGIAIDAANNLYVTSLATHRAYRVSAATGHVVTIAGNGAAAFSGDGGLATKASLYRPYAAIIDGAGDLLFADSESGRIRKVTLAGLSAAPGTLTFDSRLPTTTSLARRVVISNLGSTAITVASLTASGGFALVTHTCAVVPAGGDCSADLAFTPSAVGTVNGTLTAATDAGTFVSALSGTGELSLVTFYYESILGRSPDSSGKPFWDGERARMQSLGANINETWFAMSSSFFTSAEYFSFNRDATGFVTDLYKTFFNRAPDGPGLQFWTGQIAAGLPREVVLAEFQLSTEFKSFTQGMFGDTAARAEVDMVMDFYRGFLGRLPDSGGFNFWVGQFRAAQCQGGNAPAAVAATAHAISEQFAESGEYLGKARSNPAYVGDLYNAFLRRGGELQGVQGWIDELDAGTLTRPQMRDDFRASGEFGARLSAVAGAGCLP